MHAHARIYAHTHKNTIRIVLVPLSEITNQCIKQMELNWDILNKLIWSIWHNLYRYLGFCGLFNTPIHIELKKKCLTKEYMWTLLEIKSSLKRIWSRTTNRSKMYLKQITLIYDTNNLIELALPKNNTIHRKQLLRIRILLKRIRKHVPLRL